MIVLLTSQWISNTKWFIGGKCNIVDNAIDGHVKCQLNKIAYIFENAKGTDNTILVIKNHGPQ
jgi:hypothetical protein